METLTGIHDFLHLKLGDSLYFIFGFLVIISLVAQWRLYEKAGQPGVAAIVPVWNFIVFLKVVGRPPSHLFLALIPIFGQLYFIPKVWIEVCQSFGKRTMMDYVMVILLNGLYILNLGLSYETEYEGPVYGRELTKGDSSVKGTRTAMA